MKIKDFRREIRKCSEGENRTTGKPEERNRAKWGKLYK